MHFSEHEVVLTGNADSREIYAMRGFSAAAASGRAEPEAGKDLYLAMTMIFRDVWYEFPPGVWVEPNSACTLPPVLALLSDFAKSILFVAAVDCELSMSTDTVHWTRVFPGIPFIPRGVAGSYDAKLNYCGSQPFAVNESVALYYMGNRHPHNASEVGPFSAHPGGSLDLARLRLDGWGGYTPCATSPPPSKACPGPHCNWPCPNTTSVVTNPIRFGIGPSVLRVNLEIRAARTGLRVEVRHASNGSAVPCYFLRDSARVAADGVDVLVSWGGKGELPTVLAGSDIVLVFALEGAAVLYSYSLACI